MPRTSDADTVLEEAPHIRLAPWRLISHCGAECLFGFAVYHNETVGSSWMRSSGVQLDAVRRCVGTATGRPYELGRRIEATDHQEPEVCAADHPLLGEPDCGEEARLLGAWLSSCKMAQWPGLQPPPRDPPGVMQFPGAHGGAHRAPRSGRHPC